MRSRALEILTIKDSSLMEAGLLLGTEVHKAF